jgi:putative sporulation protein YyaC
MNFEIIKEELRKVVTSDTVFACVGTNKVIFDMFGPLCGELLKNKNIPYYGDFDDNINSVNMYRRLNEIYKIDKRENKNIIAIDAAVTEDLEKVNTMVFKDRGVKPGAGMGKRFPIIGDHSILLFTLSNEDLRKTMTYYRKGNNIGRSKDLSNEGVIKEYAIKLIDVIEEVYNEVCSVNKC